MPDTAHTPADHLTPREAARRLNISLDYVYKLVWADQLEAKKIGRQWRIAVDAVDARIQRRAATVGA